MKKHISLEKIAIKALEKKFVLTGQNIGEDAKMSKKGVTFETKVYNIDDIGQICTLKMKALLGLLKMETIVLSVKGRDIPLFNMDWVSALGKETLICELYDVQLSTFSAEAQEKFDAIRRRDDDIPETEQDEYWYKDILYPCSYHKTGKKITNRLNDASIDYFKTIVNELSAAQECSSKVKYDKIRNFAETLFNNGGPAVDMVKELFGTEKAHRLIVGHMYGCYDSAHLLQDDQ